MLLLSSVRKRVRYAVSPVQKADMDKTVWRSVSVTTTVFVCRRLEVASAVPGTQVNGKTNIWQHCVIYLYYLHIHFFFSFKMSKLAFTAKSRKLRS